MKNKKTLGKVVAQIGGFRIRLLITPVKNSLSGKLHYYGVYTGKHLFKTGIDIETCKEIAEKLNTPYNPKVGKGYFHRALYEEFEAFKKSH